MKKSRPNQLTFWLPQRVCGAVLLLVFGLCAASAQEPLSWPNRPPYVRLWTGEEFVLMPADAARAAQSRLHNVPPEHWGVDLGTLPSDAEHPRQVVSLMADDGNTSVWVSFLATRHFWSLLNDRNVASLNTVMRQLGRDLVASGLDDEPKRSAYLDRLDWVEYGISIILDDQFVDHRLSYEGERPRWLGGREKSVDALQSLCHDVAVTRQGGEVTFTYNKLLFNGSVVRRTIHARTDGRWLELLRLETVELRSAGTFSYPVLI